MAVFDAFIGPSYTAQSANVDCENSMNLYAEAIEGGASGKAKIVLYGTPGITTFCTLPTSPVRGLWANATRLFAVAGSKLYEVNSAGLLIDLTGATGTTVTFARGDVGNDGLPIQIFPNGNQILIVSAGVAYCDSGAGPVEVSIGTPLSGMMNVTDVAGHPAIGTWVSGDLFDAGLVGVVITVDGGSRTVATVSNDGLRMTMNGGGILDPQPWSGTPALGAQSGAFLDGYFIVSQPNSRQINFSAINDGTTWDPLDSAQKAAYPDYIQSLLADHEEVWLLGTDTIEVFQNTGAALNPLTRIPGALIHHGSVAQYAPQRLQNGIAWLSSDPARGGCIAYLAQGFQPTRISTHALETVWSGYSTVADAVSFTYTDQGHEFWVITFPAANATWVFDATSGWWHPRGWWNGTSIDRQRQMFHAFVFGQHIVGDWSTGALYVQSLAAFTDAGTQINRIRTAPHLSTEQLWSFYNRFQLDLELGQSITTPSVSLDWSDDGGHTWHGAVAATPTDATFAARMVWRRLGRSRDRVWRVTITAAVKIALIRAILDVEQGSA